SRTVGMPSHSATARPRRRLSGSESCSGMRMPSTFAAPKARTERAATTLESTPPERPSTAPLRRRRFSTCERSAVAMRSTSAVADDVSLAESLVGGDDRLDRLAEDRVGHADHRDLAHPSELVDDVLDFLRAHLLAARLDDVVLAADEVEKACFVGAEEIARVQ